MEIHKCTLSFDCLALIVFLLTLCTSAYGIDCSTDIEGIEGDSDSIHSPGFPESYPKRSSSYRCTYRFLVHSTDGYILLSFDDFHLNHEPALTCKNNGTYDFITINFHNNQDPSYYCALGRPPPIFSLTNKVTVELVVHSGDTSTFRGFSMKYRFISAATKLEQSKIYLEVKTTVPEVTNDEGRFSAMIGQMPSSGYTSQSVDFIWYITAPLEGNRVLLTVKDVHNVAYYDSSMLIIKDGPTSMSTTLQHTMITRGSSAVSTQRFMYVQLSGMVDAQTALEIEFSFFLDPDVNGRCAHSYFHCMAINRCIYEVLRCNNRDNCGDGEDELCTTSCDTNPCHNGGICKVSSPPLTFICSCPSPYVGLLCTQTYDTTTLSINTPCADTCFNGGRCVDGHCSCPNNFFGKQCQFAVTDGKSDDLEHTSIMIGAFVGAVCLLSICWLVAMARKRNSDGEVTSPSHRGPQRMVSIHTPEELGLRRSATIGPGDLEIPPTYDEVFKPAVYIQTPSLSTINEPRSPPPSYDVVTHDEEDTAIIVNCIPEEADEVGDMEIIINSIPESPTSVPDLVYHNNNIEDNGSISISRQTSRSTDV